MKKIGEGLKTQTLFQLLREKGFIFSEEDFKSHRGKKYKWSIGEIHGDTTVTKIFKNKKNGISYRKLTETIIVSPK